jgi:transposase
VLPKSPIGKAFTYTLNQWLALCRYTEDGALSIDNNLAERLMKPPAIGRKNFPGTAAQRWSWQRNRRRTSRDSAEHHRQRTLCGVEPWAWLNAVFRGLPLRVATTGLANTDSDKPPDLTDLLPDNWLKSHPQHHWQIDDIRQKERERSRQQKISKRKRR